MARFDPALWRQRTARRFRKSVSAGSKSAFSRYVQDLIAIEELGVLLEWCADRDLDVSFTSRANGYYDPNVQSIQLNSNLRPERQLHLLLHESGHFLIEQSNVVGQFSAGYSAPAGAPKGVVHSVDIVDEELEAWRRGLRLAKRLDLRVHEGRYNQTRAEYVRTYMKWAVKAGDYDFEETDSGKT